MGGGSKRKETENYAINMRNDAAALGTQLTGQGQATMGAGMELMKP